MKILIAPLLSIALLAGCGEEADTAAAPADATAEAAAPAAVDPAAAPVAGADAQSMGMAGDAAGTVATATGTVESVDAAANKIVIAHGPVEALKWPSMTMGFDATPDQVQAVQAGQKVNFEFRSAGPNNTITNITPAE
ncbi:copper-binding protein [Lysobacter korlensis]|uniref:Copper-binding protein n=1 Tax=Lysobacter korlensis TaxID=553636 RepID=A0ABV6RPX8_9GAMM